MSVALVKLEMMGTEETVWDGLVTHYTLLYVLHQLNAQKATGTVDRPSCLGILQLKN